MTSQLANKMFKSDFFCSKQHGKCIDNIILFDKCDNCVIDRRQCLKYITYTYKYQFGKLLLGNFTRNNIFKYIH